MKRPTQKMAYHTIKGIPGIAREGESIVIDPKNQGILVGRSIPWSELDYLMSHEDSLRVDGEYCRGRPNHIALVTD